ncbi:hypothetical protein BDV96DRAFT_254784 [Lophiotrema nucula]|uniref:Uncharacterized protein n=1 Tax=Lophiotrema nucula TaxID=690887 RepID=A0A6A5YS03_9PLEO|nr:hypothetical protein BDV96DRAFT_254784 [Lophiotrema nucula]
MFAFRYHAPSHRHANTTTTAFGVSDGRYSRVLDSIMTPAPLKQCSHILQVSKDPNHQNSDVMKPKDDAETTAVNITKSFLGEDNANFLQRHILEQVQISGDEQDRADNTVVRLLNEWKKNQKFPSRGAPKRLLWTLTSTCTPLQLRDGLNSLAESDLQQARRIVSACERVDFKWYLAHRGHPIVNLRRSISRSVDQKTYIPPCKG